MRQNGTCAEHNTVNERVTAETRESQEIDNGQADESRGATMASSDQKKVIRHHHQDWRNVSNPLLPGRNGHRCSLRRISALVPLLATPSLRFPDIQTNTPPSQHLHIKHDEQKVSDNKNSRALVRSVEAASPGNSFVLYTRNGPP